jgi:hypothetical protein
MRKQKIEDVLADFFDLELTPFKSTKSPEAIFDGEVLKLFDKVDFLSNSLLFKNSNPGKTKKSKTKGSKNVNSIFFPPKHKKLSKIISIVSPEEARKAVRKIKQLVGKGYTKKQLRASLILAGARAKVLAKSPHISAKEKRELKKVAEIYFNGAKSL